MSGGLVGGRGIAATIAAAGTGQRLVERQSQVIQIVKDLTLD